MRGAVLACAATLVLAAAAQADVDASAKFGFGGRWIVEAATPVVVTLRNSGAEPVLAEISVVLSEHMGRDDQVVIRRLQLAAGATRDETFLVPGPSGLGGVRVEIVVDPKTPLHAGRQFSDDGTITIDVADRTRETSGEVAYQSNVLGVVGDARGVIAGRVRFIGASESDTPARRRSLRLEVLAVDAAQTRLAPLGWDGLDAVLVLDPDEKFAAGPDELDALLDWVALGGRLVVSLGEHATQFIGSPLARELPATWAGTTRADYGGLLDALGAEHEGESSGPWTALRANAFALPGEADMFAGAPLVVERALGEGRIALLPYDVRRTLAAATIGGIQTALRPVLDVPDSDENERSGGLTYGVAQWLALPLQAGAFTPPPLGFVILGIVLYVIVVGPVDWFVLKRLKKQRLTTLTFAGAVTGFTLLAYGASMLLFSSGARVNRLVFADLADAGRDGRQLLRLHDLAGYYSPTGSDQQVSYSMPAAVMASALPGSGVGDLGSSLPVTIASPDALRPRALVQLAFRSQRVVRAQTVGAFGPSLDVEWKGEGGGRSVRVVNGLPIDLDDVVLYVDATRSYSLGPAKSGAATNDGGFIATTGKRAQGPTLPHVYGNVRVAAKALDPDSVRRLLETITLVGSGGARRVDSRDETAVLVKSGIAAGDALAHGRGLLIAFASRAPVPLPGSGTAGDTYVVLRKEVKLP